jgi:peptidyl-prolyl cis-trans isomerase C
MLKFARIIDKYTRFVGCGLAACAVLFGATSVRAQDLLRVNGTTITQEEVLAVNPEAASNVQLRQEIAEQLAQQQLLADTIKKVPADLVARINAGQKNMERQALAQLAANQFLQSHPVTNAQIKTDYDKIIAALPPQQFWLRWIVVKTSNEAKAVIDELRTGKRNFVTLSIEQSIGQNADLGGALGWQSEQTLQAAVLGVVRKLKVGQVAGPIAFEGGYAIVQLVAKRDTPKPTLDQLRPQIEEQLRNAALQQHMQKLAKSAKIENLMQSKAPNTNDGTENEKK